MNDKLKALQARLGAKSGAIARVLSSPDGKMLMDALEEEFVWGDLQAKDDRQMHFNHGARDVVLYLRSMIKTAERMGDTDG